MKNIDKNKHLQYKPGLYIICIISSNNCTQKLANQIYCMKDHVKNVNWETCFRIVDISSIHSNCSMALDPMVLDDHSIFKCDY